MNSKLKDINRYLFILINDQCIDPGTSGTESEAIMEKELKEIDQASKDTVYGYIRIFNTETIIPMEICYLCLLFYYFIPEQFLKYGDNIDVSSSDASNGKSNDIANLDMRDSNEWVYAILYGNMIINPIKNPNAIIEWTIKNEIASFVVGIHSTRKILGESRKYVRAFSKGDVIKMELNIPKRELIFLKNDKHRHICRDIDTSKEYHLWATVCTILSTASDNYVQLMDYQVKGHQCLSFYSK